jgi:hypothetical protein
MDKYRRVGINPHPAQQFFHYFQLQKRYFLEPIFRNFYYLIFILPRKNKIDWKNSESDSEFFHIFVGWYNG